MPYKWGDKYKGLARMSDPKRREEKTFATKKDAAKWERDTIESWMKELSSPQNVMDLLTFTTKYLDEVEVTLTPKVYSEKKSLVKRILNAWGIHTPVVDVTTEMVYDLIKDRATNNLFNKDRKNLLAMWRFGQDILDLQTDPVIKIKKRSHTVEKQYVPPTTDVLKVIAVATRVDMVFLDCFLQLGARRSEILRWTWADDVNFERRQVRLGTRKTKGGGMRYDWMPMTDTLYDSLWWW
ncbi:MAG: hypothetical protein CSYNP_03865 [Syntrophus sp. SKADARSKE-3]|nr:hypothetical protein [Syntrophus sp. SKADARSKE-3]